MAWLQCVFETIVEEKSCRYMSAIAQSIRWGNEFLRLLYRGGLWLSRAQASAVLHAGEEFCRNYMLCAQHALIRRVLRFKLSPKMHAFAHFLFDLRVQLSMNVAWAASPTMANCQMDEDFVGRISALTCFGSFKRTHKTTLMRYLIHLEEHW